MYGVCWKVGRGCGTISDFEPKRISGHLVQPPSSNGAQTETLDGRLTNLEMLESRGRQIAGSLRSNWEKGRG